MGLNEARGFDEAREAVERGAGRRFVQRQQTARGIRPFEIHERVPRVGGWLHRTPGRSLIISHRSLDRPQ